MGSVDAPQYHGLRMTYPVFVVGFCLFVEYQPVTAGWPLYGKALHSFMHEYLVPSDRLTRLVDVLICGRSRGTTSVMFTSMQKGRNALGTTGVTSVVQWAAANSRQRFKTTGALIMVRIG